MDSGTTTSKPWSDIDKSLRDQVDGITLLMLTFTAADLELFPRLKVLVRMGVGYDGVDRAALAARGVTLCNVPDYGTADIADHALALALTLRRGIALHHDLQRAQPTPAPFTAVGSPLVSRLRGATFGVVGLGAIGMAAALRAKAFGWDVVFFDPGVASGVEQSLGVRRVREVRDLFRQSSTVSLHCPLTPQTRGMVGRELLGLLPRGAVLVNTARGEIVDLDAVERCLRDGTLAGVGLDVLPEEPIPEDESRVHPLLKAYRKREEWLVGRLVITPHSAWNCPESVADVRVKSAETMRDVLIRGQRVNVIPPPRPQ
ncbi:hypothetical protein SLS57_012482 [Botryosphaeria dothidea]